MKFISDLPNVNYVSISVNEMNDEMDLAISIHDCHNYLGP